ncbi:glucosamine-6-phosphate deaminase, partial [Streptomyces sp. NPDC004542]
LHPHATLIADEPAAAKLKHADYFRYTYAGKPDWQGI